jgi:hypothetical protein
MIVCHECSLTSEDRYQCHKCTKVLVQAKPVKGPVDTARVFENVPQWRNHG